MRENHHPSSVGLQSSLCDITASTRRFLDFAWPPWLYWAVDSLVIWVTSRTVLTWSGYLRRFLTREAAIKGPELAWMCCCTTERLRTGLFLGRNSGDEMTTCCPISRIGPQEGNENIFNHFLVFCCLYTNDFDCKLSIFMKTASYKPFSLSPSDPSSPV